MIYYCVRHCFRLRADKLVRAELRHKLLPGRAVGQYTAGRAATQAVATFTMRYGLRPKLLRCGLRGRIGTICGASWGLNFNMWVGCGLRWPALTGLYNLLRHQCFPTASGSNRLLYSPRDFIRKWIRLDGLVKSAFISNTTLLRYIVCLS